MLLFCCGYGYMVSLLRNRKFGIWYNLSFIFGLHIMLVLIFGFKPMLLLFCFSIPVLQFTHELHSLLATSCLCNMMSISYQVLIELAASHAAQLNVECSPRLCLIFKI